MANQPSDPHLASFIRPRDDNGMGLHFILDAGKKLSPEDADPQFPFAQWANVAGYAHFLNDMHMRWTTVVAQSQEVAVTTAAYLFHKYGIVSNIRLDWKGDTPHNPSDWVLGVELANKYGVPPYFQVFNEPLNGKGVEGFNDAQDFADKWGPRALAIAQAGGYPGLQVLDKESFDAVMVNLHPLVRERMFFALHNYGGNHGPAYPFPPFHPRAGMTLPGDPVGENDDTCVLRFLEFAQWFKAAIGFVPPMIGGESAWLYQNHDDTGFPPVNIENWIAWHKEMYGWFRTGILSNGAPVPDYLFSVCTWLLYAANWYSDSWVNGLDSDKKAMLIADLSAAPVFVRQFGGVVTPPPPPPPPITLAEAVVEASLDQTWMPINDKAALYQYAQAHGLGYPQTDEVETEFNGETYVLQVFERGIAYVKKGDWGNVKTVDKP